MTSVSGVDLVGDGDISLSTFFGATAKITLDCNWLLLQVLWQSGRVAECTITSQLPQQYQQMITQLATFPATSATYLLIPAFCSNPTYIN